MNRKVFELASSLVMYICRTGEMNKGKIYSLVSGKNKKEAISDIGLTVNDVLYMYVFSKQKKKNTHTKNKTAPYLVL